jgi:type IV pilus assembly protein PilM
LPLLDQIQRWIKEPPPDYLFEVSERGLAFMQSSDPASLQVRALPDKALAVSPSQLNITRADLLDAALPNGRSANGAQKRAKAALVIPDYAARISVLDFEELPSDAEQQQALIRFRLRKSVPFPIDEAKISSAVQWNEPQHKKVEVLAAAIARPVLDEYESFLRRHGFQVGLVVPSSLASLPLCAATGAGVVLFAKLSGSVLSILLIQSGLVRVVRCVDLSSEEAAADEEAAHITTILHQTFAFVEDEFAQPVERLLLCGFGAMTQTLGAALEQEFHVSWEPLLSPRLGKASSENAGLLGLLEQYAA